jgi:hypothetical protein
MTWKEIGILSFEILAFLASSNFHVVPLGKKCLLAHGDPPEPTLCPAPTPKSGPIFNIIIRTLLKQCKVPCTDEVQNDDCDAKDVVELMFASFLLGLLVASAFWWRNTKANAHGEGPGDSADVVATPSKNQPTPDGDSSDPAVGFKPIQDSIDNSSSAFTVFDWEPGNLGRSDVFDVFLSWTQCDDPTITKPVDPEKALATVLQLLKDGKAIGYMSKSAAASASPTGRSETSSESYKTVTASPAPP